MTDKKRRQFVTVLGASTVAIPVSALLGALPSHAATPMVDAESPEAKNWDYTAESTVEGSRCGNCALFQGDGGSAPGPCPLFPQKHVDPGAWCKAYAPKPS